MIPLSPTVTAIEFHIEQENHQAENMHGDNSSTTD